MTSILIDEQIDAIDPEERAVQMWRQDQFGRLGFDSVISRLLAESPADHRSSAAVAAVRVPGRDRVPHPRVVSVS